MMNLVYAFLAGAGAASVGWFFVWRNNKEFMAAELAKLEAKFDNLTAKKEDD